MATVVYELMWLRYFLDDLRITHPMPTTVYCDNLIAIHIAANPVFHELMKHIELDCHLVWYQISRGAIVITYVPSSRQLADLLTKPLCSPTFASLLLKMIPKHLLFILHRVLKIQDIQHQHIAAPLDKHKPTPPSDKQLQHTVQLDKHAATKVFKCWKQ